MKPANIIHNEYMQGLSQAVHDRKNTFLHRVWNLISSLAVIGLGLATVFSCYSPATTSVNIFKVLPVPFVQGLLANPALANNTIASNSTVGYTLPQNVSATNISVSGLPEMYYLGVSGVCRKWSDTNTTCSRTFPPNFDIPQVILQDLNHTSNTSLTTAIESVTNHSFSTWSKAASALIVTSLIWTALVLALVQFLPTDFMVQIVPLMILITLSLSSWSLYANIFYKSFDLYNSNLAVDPTAGDSAVLPGTGYWVFVAYVFCTLMITPVTAFWTLIVVLFLLFCFFVALWVSFVVFMKLLACFPAGQTTTTMYYGNNNSGGFGYGGDSGGFGGDS